MSDKQSQLQPSRTEIGELGEFGLIERLTRNIELKQKSSIKGVGDDAAVIDIGNGMVELVTTDLLMEGIHFDLSYHPLRHLGYKAVVVNLSDIYAMNGTPHQITASMGISNRFSVEALEAVYEGMLTACENYQVDLVGGDISSSQTGLVISITALGTARKEDVVYRNTAKEGNLIAVSGDLGAAYMGLQLLEREKQLYLENPQVQPDLEGEDYIVGRQLMPDPRADVIELLEELKIKPTAMIDISDGLSSDLLHICNQSGVGCRIYEEHLPIDDRTKLRAAKFQMASLTAALNGGEDYELLFTVPAEFKEKLESYGQISLIGYLTKPKDGFKVITTSGQSIELEAQGWQHV